MVSNPTDLVVLLPDRHELAHMFIPPVPPLMEYENRGTDVPRNLHIFQALGGGGA